MAGFQPEDIIPDRDIKARIRLDIKGTTKPGRFLFGGKPMDRVAEEAREQQVTLLRNVPVQGIHIDNIDIGMDIYTVFDDLNNQEVAYAPLILEVTADTVEDLVRFTTREDFRKVEVLSPATLTLHRFDLERLIFRIAEEFKNYRAQLDRKYTLR
ncbi:MAG: hypothetical protein AB1556_10355 [Bacillota bacterium]